MSNFFCLPENASPRPARVSSAPGTFTVLKRVFTPIVTALSLALSVFSAPSDALPPSTNESVEHAAVLKQAPIYREFHEELDFHLDIPRPSKPSEAQRKMDVMEWPSAKPSAEPRNVYLLCIHAWGLSAREFDGFGQEMSSRGFDTVAIDVRGFGVHRKDKGRQRIDFEGTVDDIARILRTVRKEHPEKKIFVVGESMGGAIALQVASRYPKLVDGAISSAPAWQIFGVRKITVKGLFDQVFGEPGLAAKSVASMASNDEALVKQWLTDNAYRTDYTVQEAFLYYRLMRSTPQTARDIRTVPVLVMQGVNDRLSKPDASARVFKEISNSNKQFAIVAGSEHLVLEENQLTGNVANYVEDWVLKQCVKRDDTKPAPQVVVIDAEKSQRSEIQKAQKLKALAEKT